MRAYFVLARGIHTNYVYKAFMCKQMLKYNIYLPVGTSTPFVNADLVLTLLNCTLKIVERERLKCHLVGS